MKQYELLVIFNARLDEEKTEALNLKVKGFLEAAQASVTKVDKWGVKKLAYPINYQNEGYYVIYNMEAPVNLVAAVEPKLRIEENIMRFIFSAK